MNSTTALTSTMKAFAFRDADYADKAVRVADASGDEDAIHRAIVRQREAHEVLLKFIYL